MAARQQRPSKKTRSAVRPPGSGELLLEREVQARVRLSHATIWRLRKAGLFPEPQKISRKRVVYRKADIDAVVAGSWKAPRPAASGARA